MFLRLHVVVVRVLGAEVLVTRTAVPGCVLRLLLHLQYACV